MFETSVVQARALAAQRRVGLVSVSLGAHALAIFGALALSVAAVDFPSSVPRQMMSFQVAGPPPPLGNPNGGKPPEPKPQVKPEQRAQTPSITEVTAPTVVPEKTPAAESSGDPSPSATPGTGLVPGPIGTPDGDPHSVDTTLTQTPVVNVPTTPAILQPGIGDVKPARVLSRVEPRYPPAMQALHMTAVVRIHCVIDKDGRVRDPQIVVSSYPPFNNSVLQALDKWTFAPGTLHGQPVDTYFDLTVTFTVK